MNDQVPDQDQDQTDAKPANANTLWRELGPVILYVVSYNLTKRLPEDNGLFSSENAIYLSTGLFAFATLAVLAYLFYKKEKPSAMLLVSAALITVFNGLAIGFSNPKFIYMKPTVINLIYAGLIFGGLAFGKNIWKIAFGRAFSLPDFAWKTLAIRWGIFFIFLAILNEAIWRTQTEEFWVNSKLVIMMPASFLFMMANLPYLMKHSLDDTFKAKDDSKSD